MKKRIRGFDNSSVEVQKIDKKVVLKIFVRGGTTFCNLSPDKARDLGNLLLKASEEANQN